MLEDDDEDEEKIKVIVVGETGVGKTNLINAVKGLNFNEDSISTINIKSIKKIMTIFKKNYTIKLWDTAGQEKFRALNKLFYKDSKIVLLVYDITNQESFDAIKQYWLGEIKSSLGNEIILGLVGNKSDLKDKVIVDEKIAKKFAEENNMKFKICSCKDDPKLFNLFLRNLVKDYIKNRKKKEKNDGFELDKDNGTHGSCFML